LFRSKLVNGREEIGKGEAAPYAGHGGGVHLVDGPAEAAQQRDEALGRVKALLQRVEGLLEGECDRAGKGVGHQSTLKGARSRSSNYRSRAPASWCRRR